IEGGEAELRELYHQLKDHGVKMEMAADHVLTKSVDGFDPDGNRLELCCASMEMAAAKHSLQTTHDRSKFMAPWHPEPTTALCRALAMGTVRSPEGTSVRASSPHLQEPRGAAEGPEESRNGRTIDAPLL